MGKVCSKNSAVTANTASSRRESTTTPGTAAQNGAFQKAPAESSAVGDHEGTGAAQIVTAEQRILPVELVTDASAGETGSTQRLTTIHPGTEVSQRTSEDGEKLSITTVEGESGVAPVAVIRQEKFVMEEGEKGEGVMRVSVSEAIISADLPGLPATVEGVSPEDLELLKKAHEHVKQQRDQTPSLAVVDVTNEEARLADAVASNPEADNTQKGQSLAVGENVTKAAAYGYLLYSSRKDGGSLSLMWSKEPLELDAQGAGDNQVILLSFVPAPQKTIPKSKFTTQGGRSDLMDEIETKWEVWSKLDKRKYYEGWAQAFKVCNEYEATVTVRKWSTEWPPRVNVKLLRVGPTGTISFTLRPSRPVNLSTFSYLIVLPAEAENLFKDGSGPTEKKFVDAATAAGGASLRLIRRKFGAALDQDVLLEWLKEDGITISAEQKGITLGGDHDKYERRSADRERG